MYLQQYYNETSFIFICCLDIHLPRVTSKLLVVTIVGLLASCVFHIDPVCELFVL